MTSKEQTTSNKGATSMQNSQPELEFEPVQTKGTVTIQEQSGIVIVTINDPGKKVNTLNSKLMPEFAEVFNFVEVRPNIKAMILISGKKDCFVAGADIEELAACKSAEEASHLSQSGQEMLSKLEALKIPVIAAIEGSCLGGGLELALACSYRIAVDSKKTQIGLPEVMLGLLPGAGGTQRLPRLIGLEEALSLILTGASCNAKKALKLGIVDTVIASSNLLPAALKIANDLASGALKVTRGRHDIKSTIVSSFAGRSLILSQARKMIMAKTKGLYPAPLAILDVIGYGLANGMAKGLAKEATEFGRLSQTNQSKALISIYFAQTELKKNPYGNKQLAHQTIGVLGAGLMGAGIGLVSIQKGYNVRLKDLSEASLAQGEKYIWSELDSQIKRKKLNTIEAKAVFSKLYSQTNWDLFTKCDLLIEAVFEDLELKKRVLREAEAACRPDMVFASNTSALPIAEIASASSRPEQVLGMHYFSPVHKMPLLEIIRTDKTSNDALAMAVSVGQRQGKTVIVVNDGPGFYTTRILVPFMDEAALLALEGIDFHYLDKVMIAFGYPVGPITLMDEVGLDVSQHITHDLGKIFGKRFCGSDTSVLSEFAEKKALGRKAGRGFYLYGNKNKGPFAGLLGRKAKVINPDALAIMQKYGKSSSKIKVEAEDIQIRTTYRLLNEAAYCLQDQVLLKPQDGDIGAIFGLGFPPFLGGPFRYMDTIGVAKVVDALKQFELTFGERFRPCELLQEMALKNSKFYPKG